MSRSYKLYLNLAVLLLPWFLRRRLMNWLCSYRISPTAYVGLSIIGVDSLVMGDYARIGHLNVIVNLDYIELGNYSSIDRSNWITGFPLGNPTHFSHVKNRSPRLVLGCHSAITKRHHLDCTDSIAIGGFSTIAGYHSQFLTHSIDIRLGLQNCAPITLGSFVFVGTNVVVLGGSCLPDYCVLGAKSLLNRVHVEKYTLYGGVPAKGILELPKDSKYFNRLVGFVD